MAQKKSGELKKRAWLAKQRLKMGYWTSSKNIETDEISDEKRSAHIKYTYSYGDVDPQNEKMYKKVCAMLDSDEMTINPIGQLIDHEVYGSLDEGAKQRYVLELSNTFRELKERYYREKTGA